MPKSPVPKADSARRRRRALLATILAAVLVGAGVVVAVVASSDSGPARTGPPSPLARAEDAGVRPAEAGCRPVEYPKYQGRIKVGPGSKHAGYSSNPPTSGWFFPPMNAGAYAVLPPIERLMTIPANGGIAVWTSDAEALQARRWFNVKHRNDVLVLQDATRVKSGVVLVAWGLLQRCDRFSGQVATAFLDRFTNMAAVKAHEPTAQPIEG